MTTYTIYSGSADGFINSQSTTYSLARSGTALTANTASATFEVGQLRSGSTRHCDEGFVTFDCSGVTGSASSATLNLFATFDNSTAEDFITEARAHTWSGSGLTTADWVAGADLASKTLLATWNSTDYTDEAYEAFTSEAALLTAVDAHGTLDILLCSDKQTNNSDPPSGNSYIRWRSADQTGTSEDPYLEVIVSSDSPGARLVLGPKIERMRLVA